jgi:hypothetical protein
VAEVFPGQHAPLRTLYDYRTDADYMAREITQTEANDGLTLAREILAFMAQAKGLVFP